jgi:hypothetical protein
LNLGQKYKGLGGKSLNLKIFDGFNAFRKRKRGLERNFLETSRNLALDFRMIILIKKKYLPQIKDSN